MRENKNLLDLAVGTLLASTPAIILIMPLFLVVPTVIVAVFTYFKFDSADRYLITIFSMLILVFSIQYHFEPPMTSMKDIIDSIIEMF